MTNNITLAFDTSLDRMYIALMDNENLLESKIIQNHDEKYHSAFLISSIKEILRNNNLKPCNLDLIAVNIGPGSFTGIRACVTTARIMAQQLNCKVIGISSLEILSKLCEGDVAVALDARREKAYLYLNNEIKGAIDLDCVKQFCKGKKVITDDKLKPLLGGVSYREINAQLGEILAKLAIEKAKKQDCDWTRLKPLYIQPPPMG